MENADCIDEGSVKLMTDAKRSFQYLACGAVCGIILVGILIIQQQSTASKDYAQIISQQKAMQALAMRTNLSY